jgi:adenylate cyclase
MHKVVRANYPGRMRVPRTFVFLDLSGFTNYTAAFGDDAAGRLLSAFRTIVREVASDRGVRIAKWLGDGCMVVSVEQADAIAFTLDLEGRAAEVCSPLTLRAGIATGYALLFEGDDYIGSAVNMASRLCDIANDFEVLIPAMGMERLPEGVIATPHGPVELAGFPGEIEIFELSGIPAAADRNDTGELWTRTPFI